MGLVSFAAALLPFQLQPLRNAKNYPDLHPSQLYCTQLHWHLSPLFVSQYFCPLSLWALVSKEGACLVCSPHIWSICSNLLSPQYTWCSLDNSYNPSAWKRVVLFVFQGTLLITWFPIYFLSPQCYFLTLNVFIRLLSFWPRNFKLQMSFFPLFKHTFRDTFFLFFFTVFCLWIFYIQNSKNQLIFYSYYRPDFFCQLLFLQLKVLPHSKYNAI